MLQVNEMNRNAMTIQLEDPLPDYPVFVEAMRRAPGSGAKDDENAQDQMEGNPHAQEK